MSDGAKFGVECQPEILLLKLEVAKGVVMRDRAKIIAKMRSIKEEAKSMETQLRDVIKVRPFIL